MENNLRIIPVSSKREYKDFIEIPWLLHGHDPLWVPPLRMVVKKNLDTKKNPFYANAKLQNWIAYRGDKPVGRISAILNNRHNEYHNVKAVGWGFFECEDNVATAAALFQQVETWARQHKMNEVFGPVSPSTNHDCGLQISAFEHPPFIMMTQNPAYYQTLVEANGHQKAKDLNAWLVDQRTTNFNPHLLAGIEKLRKSEDITVRYLNMKNFKEEIKQIFTIYNDAWEKNWGFVPLDYDEFADMAKEMKSIIIPESVPIVEVKGEMAAFGIWLPDLNQVLIHMRSGKLLPTGLLKLLWHTKVKKSINQGRLIALGVKQKFRHLQLPVLIYMQFFQTVPKLGYPVAECSWVLEDNQSMNVGLKFMNGKAYKTYRIYKKELSIPITPQDAKL